MPLVFMGQNRWPYEREALCRDGGARPARPALPAGGPGDFRKKIWAESNNLKYGPYPFTYDYAQ